MTICRSPLSQSLLGGKADMPYCVANVCFDPKRTFDTALVPHGPILSDTNNALELVLNQLLFLTIR